MIHRSQRALVLHSRLTLLLTTQHMRLIQSSNFPALDFIEVVWKCFKYCFLFFLKSQIGGWWIEKCDIEGKGETFNHELQDRKTACTHLYCTMAMLALTEQELSYFSMMRWMFLCKTHMCSDFIISLVWHAILIILLDKHNVANHALKLTATICQVWWCIALIINFCYN